MSKKNNGETKELASIEPIKETYMDWTALKEQAEMLVKSKMLPIAIDTPEKAIAIAITSKELGIGMMEGFRSINVIQGKPTVSPQLMLALANRTGKLENLKIDATDQRCIVEIKRVGRDVHTEEFGVKEATALGLMNRDNYNKQRATMFKWRALAANLRVTFPDAVLGLYTPEEMGAEVKVLGNEEMEVVSTPDDMVNTGIRVPKDFWELQTDEEKEARIGKGNKVQKTEKGWFIFSPAKEVENFNQEMEKEKPKEKPGTYITHDEQLELFRQIKRKNIDMESFRKMVKEELGADGTAKIKNGDYDKAMEWIIKNERDAQ